MKEYIIIKIKDEYIIATGETGNAIFEQIGGLYPNSYEAVHERNKLIKKI